MVSMTESGDGRHVLDGGACWCGFNPNGYAADRAAGRLGTTPTSHLVAMAVHEQEKRAEEHKAEVAAAYNSGRADERRDVLAWLRTRDEATGAAGFAYAATQIEALAHHPGQTMHGREHVLSADCWCLPTVKEVPDQ